MTKVSERGKTPVIPRAPGPPTFGEVVKLGLTLGLLGALFLQMWGTRRRRAEADMDSEPVESGDA